MKAFLVLAVVMILGSFAVSNVRRLDSPQLEQTLLRAATGDTEAAAILRATVRIRLVAPYLDERGNRVLMHDNGRPMGLDAINHGLGTLVAVGGRTLIVTHDHYSEIDTAVADAMVTDYSGREVALPIGEFRKLIRYRNNGVMVLDAPAGLPPGAPLGDGVAIEPGRVVRLVHRQPETGALSVVDAVVETWIEYQGIPSYTLRNVNGEIVAPGNSGGGVWAEGRLVGGIHRTILTRGAADSDLPAPSHRSYATRLSLVQMAGPE